MRSVRVRLGVPELGAGRQQPRHAPGRPAASSAVGWCELDEKFCLDSSSSSRARSLSTSFVSATSCSPTVALIPPAPRCCCCCPCCPEQNVNAAMSMKTSIYLFRCLVLLLDVLRAWRSAEQGPTYGRPNHRQRGGLAMNHSSKRQYRLKSDYKAPRSQPQRLIVGVC